MITTTSTLHEGEREIPTFPKNFDDLAHIEAELVRVLSIVGVEAPTLW